MKQIEILKGKHLFRFRYTEGDEQAVLDTLVEFVHRRDLSFDWFEAAVLSHQLGQHMAKELLPPKPPENPASIDPQADI